MQSLADSIKNELFDQLFDSINQEFGIKKASTIPPDERLYIIHDTDEEVIAKKIADRQAYIEEKYGKQKKLTHQ
jgi:hypothetical protein